MVSCLNKFERRSRWHSAWDLSVNRNIIVKLIELNRWLSEENIGREIYEPQRQFYDTLYINTAFLSVRVSFLRRE